MPNHVTTILDAPEGVIDALIDPEGQVSHNWGGFDNPVIVDFDRIIPSPPNKEAGNCNMQSHQPGVVCWYEWNIANWGTKWGGYDAGRLNPATVQFDTAWSHPTPVIVALSQKFPDAVLHIRYADEDLGQNLGEYWIRDGEITQETELEEATPEALEFAAQIKYGRPYAELEAEWAAEEAEWAAKYAEKQETLNGRGGGPQAELETS